MSSQVDKSGLRLLEAILPQHCALCGLPSQRSLALCRDCEAELAANATACARCAIPLPPDQSEGPGQARWCGACLRKPPPFARVIAPWLYSEYMGHLIHRWKY